MKSRLMPVLPIQRAREIQTLVKEGCTALPERALRGGCWLLQPAEGAVEAEYAHERQRSQDALGVPRVTAAAGRGCRALAQPPERSSGICRAYPGHSAGPTAGDVRWKW